MDLQPGMGTTILIAASFSFHPCIIFFQLCFRALNLVWCIIYAGKKDDKFTTQARNTIFISRGLPKDPIGTGLQAGWYNSREIYIQLFWRSVE
jgi:hypothetical protein